MKKVSRIFLGMAIAAAMCVVTAPIASAKEAADTGTPPQQVKCCMNGECKTMAAKDCINGGGNPVGDCKQCKKTQ